MGSVLSWIANSALLVLGCFLAADIVNDVIAATLLAPSPATSVSAPAGSATPQRSWNDRQVILARNLFNSSTLSTPPAQDELEDIEKSKLPMTLLGTFAATDPAQSRATIKDREKNLTLVVGIGDEIRSQALVTRIERRRVVLNENGAPRELTLDEEDENAPPLVRRRQTSRAQPPPAVPARQVRRIGNDRFEVSRTDVQAAVRNPAELLRQARVQPAFEDGEMVGLKISSIKAGSVFEEIGVQEGDVITELNGMAIESPGERMEFLQEILEADELNVVLRGSDGREKVLNASVSE